MKLCQICFGTFFVAVLASDIRAQPYHTDTTVSGVQTLEVEGDLSVKQYGGGYGGDLNVTGDAKIAQGGQALPGLPSGVSGTYYGTLKVGSLTNIGEYVFEKTGDNDSGDFVVPLGRFGEWEGATIQLDVWTGPDDADSGAAHFTIMSKRHRGNGDLTAVMHTAFGGGKGIKIHGWNTHGVTYLYLEFDATSNSNTVRPHRAVVRASTIGEIAPLNRDASFAEMIPIRLADSLASDAIFGDDMTHSLNAGNIVLNGNVAVPSGKVFTIGGEAAATESYVTSTAASAINAKLSSSFATGNAIAAGYKSSALSSGYAVGLYSTAMSEGWTVGTNSTAMSAGYAGGDHSTAMVWGQAMGINSLAFMGIASGDYSLSLGGISVGERSTTIGWHNQSEALASVVLGSGGYAPGSSTEWIETDAVFAVGNAEYAQDPQASSNAIKTLKNGQTTLTNKFWDNEAPQGVPTNGTQASDGNALIVEGHSRLKGNTVMEGQVIITESQGDINMGIYQ